MKLYKVSQGQCLELAESVGKFGFYFYPSYEGLYVVGIGKFGVVSNQNFKFYLKREINYL